MSSLQTAPWTMALDTDSPAEILERINRFYIHNVNFTTFVTVFLARFDPVNLELTYVNADIIRQPFTAARAMTFIG
ncbi:MAG: SpoIIE family protein phosphatase [Anaerolineales bacterium]